jgi:hypothetical protein
MIKKECDQHVFKALVQREKSTKPAILPGLNQTNPFGAQHCRKSEGHFREITSDLP